MKLLREVLLFLTLFAFWSALSGRVDPVFIAMGLISSAVVAWFASHLIEHAIGSASRHARVSILRVVVYLGWLVWRIAPSAVEVARIVLDPRLPPRPGIVRFRTDLVSPAARTVLANSITLVPGTMTLDVVGDEICVHTFTPEAVDDIATAVMQNRIAAIFRDVHQEPPEMVWESGHTPSGFLIPPTDPLTAIRVELDQEASATPDHLTEPADDGEAP